MSPHSARMAAPLRGVCRPIAALLAISLASGGCLPMASAPATSADGDAPLMSVAAPPPPATTAIEAAEAATADPAAADTVTAQPPAAIAPSPSSVPERVAPSAPPVELARRILAREARKLAPEQREAIAQILAKAEEEYGVEAVLVLSLITQESRFDPRAVGPRGSLGLMQVRPFVGKDVAARHGLPWIGDETLYDPVQNVEIGLRYLIELLDMFVVTEWALAAYNMGPYRLRRLLQREGSLRFDYVERVQGHYQGYQQRLGNVASRWGG